MTLINKLNSLFDEKTWNQDSSIKPPSLYQIDTNFVSIGEISSGLDRDYYKISGSLLSDIEYEIFLTSDATNHGWSTFAESSFIEFDLYDYSGSLIDPPA